MGALKKIEIFWQGEQLRRAVAERRGRQYRAAEAAVEEMARRKEAEAAAAAKRRAELEERVGQMEAEVEVWAARARAQEAAAEALRAELRRAAAELVAGGEAAAADSESAYVDPNRVEVVGAKTMSDPACRACRRRYVSVVFVPCRHLCVCSECDSVVSTCPICRVPRSGSIHVLI